MTRPRLRAHADASLAALSARMIARAARIAIRAGQAQQLASRDEDAPWRRAELVWPLFPKG